MKTLLGTLVVSLGFSLAASGIDKRLEPAPDKVPAKPTTIRVNGSDTMLQLGLTWMEVYKTVRPNVSLEWNGMGSGVGMKSLIDGATPISTSSRPMKDSERKRFMAKHGKAPREHVVGYDVVGVYAHPDNPTKGLSMKQLAKIYGEGGDIAKWSQVTPAFDKPIQAAGRSNSSGTYGYFKKTVLGLGNEMKAGVAAFPGSTALVEYVSTNPTAIGYSAYSYKTDMVKFLGLTNAAGMTTFPQDDGYPLRRPLYIYSAIDVDPEVESLLRWIKSAKGQRIVEENGFMPIR